MFGMSGIQAQAVSPSDAIDLVDRHEAATILKSYILQQESTTATTSLEEATQSLKIQYARHLLNGGREVSQSLFVNDVRNGQYYLENEVTHYAPASRPNIVSIYQEVYDLLD